MFLSEEVFSRQFIPPPSRQVVQLVRQGTQVREGSVGERITFGQQLQQAFGDFVNTFLPHMEEEEQVFQVSQLQHHP